VLVPRARHAGSKPRSAVGEPRQCETLGKVPDSLRAAFKRTKAGTEFNFHAAETSQRAPNLVFEQPHVFSISRCLRRLSKASLLSSGSMKIWWKKAFRRGRCILMDASKTDPKKRNYELLKIASSRVVFSDRRLGSRVLPYSTAPRGCREIIICCCFSLSRASFQRKLSVK